MRKFRDLSIWMKSHLLSLKIYSITKTYPKEELFSLITQMKNQLPLYQLILPKDVVEIRIRISNVSLQ